MAVNRVIEVRTQFAYTHEVHPEDQCILKSAGGDFLNVCVIVNLDLSINHLSMSHEFVVVENLTLNVLIGYDFMYKFNVVIDFVNLPEIFLEIWLWPKYLTSQVS